MKNVSQSVRVIVAAAALVVSASAQTVEFSAGKFFKDSRGWVEESTGRMNAGTGFRLSSQVGSVVLRGGDQSDITITVRKRMTRGSEEDARRTMRAFNISAATRAGVPTVIGQWYGSNEGRLNVEYDIRVPRQLEYAKVDTKGGSIHVSNIAGKAWLQTAGGFITMDQIGGSVSASTHGGSIELGNGGADATLKTMGGSITVGQVSGPLRATSYGGTIQIGSGKQTIVADTAGGTISIREAGGDLKAVTAGGNLEIGAVNGGAVLTTAGGSIRLDSAKGLVRANTAGGGIRLRGLNSGAHAQTAAGGIQVEFVGPASAFSDSYLETSVGDITVSMPENLAVTVRAAIEMAHGHNIRSDFPGLKINSEGGSYGPKEVYCEGTINGGGPVLKVHATTGNIQFVKLRR